MFLEKLPGNAVLVWMAVAALSLASLPEAAAVRSIIVAPWCEEMVFRWGLHDSLMRRIGDRHRPWAALIVAIAFAMCHLATVQQPSDLPRAAATFFPALWIGLIFERAKKLNPCVAWHAIFNFAWLLGTR
jgi:membrane protease YdiL (CAAX protease family)